jgi:hypothetical protein
MSKNQEPETQSYLTTPRHYRSHPNEAPSCFLNLNNDWALKSHIVLSGCCWRLSGFPLPDLLFQWLPHFTPLHLHLQHLLHLFTRPDLNNYWALKIHFMSSG